MSEEKKNEVLGHARELDLDELDAVAGGVGYCMCPFVGGGTADEGEKPCACVVGGGGQFKNSECRCVCPIMGAGADG